MPCDMVVIGVEGGKKECYVETKGIDGESNLKVKRAVEGIEVTEGQIECELPNGEIYKFQGTYIRGEKKIPLSYDNLIMRGSSLRNTEWVIAVAVYTGHDTKIMKNSTNSRYKLSSIERDTNKQVFIIFKIMLCLCFVAATYGTIWNFSTYYPYL